MNAAPSIAVDPALLKLPLIHLFACGVFYRRHLFLLELAPMLIRIRYCHCCANYSSVSMQVLCRMDGEWPFRMIWRQCGRALLTPSLREFMVY
jgi:hypothetical protein